MYSAPWVKGEAMYSASGWGEVRFLQFLNGFLVVVMILWK
jgi:hypothetical protein